MQVEVEVPIVVAVGLVVDGGIGHTELFVDAGNEVGGLLDDGVGKCLLQIIERRLVVAQGPVTGGQCTVGTGYLIDIAEVLEQL